ncbi:hypothetical protein J1N35_013313 [Gossypium stocksii]|uniref:Uncharacterized protein n=1 Tax=Gossypium stocksii TaxID=47602 RepID=A0A9D3VS97_9ROSI|nr:hypothetical protein J1N35_013313 [Gossypium stocksii]
MHTNRAVNLSIDYAYARGVIRNHQRNWILGFNHSMGMCSIFDAELWSIFDRLTLLQNRANRIAKMAPTVMEKVNVMASAPTHILVVLESDKINIAFDCISVL